MRAIYIYSTVQACPSCKFPTPTNQQDGCHPSTVSSGLACGISRLKMMMKGKVKGRAKQLTLAEYLENRDSIKILEGGCSEAINKKCDAARAKQRRRRLLSAAQGARGPIAPLPPRSAAL